MSISIMAIRCSPSVYKIISKSIHHKQLYNTISPILCDVSLRDGIQGANPTEWNTDRKREVFDTIYKTYNPQFMEIGSLCSYKILPIMADTRELYTHAITTFQKDTESDIAHNAYVLIPNISKLQKAIIYGITHLSFITSVSDRFQMKNTNMSLTQVKSEFSLLFEVLKRQPLPEKYTKKLYISCINECPIVGKLDNDYIVNEILYYSSRYTFDELCLSDTCGSLLYDDFIYIVETIRYFGVPLSAISLHLHVSKTNLENLEYILRYCFRNGIRKFDISMIETGGCSVTMNSDRLLSNMTYEQFYTILQKHIDIVVENSL